MKCKTMKEETDEEFIERSKDEARSLEYSGDYLRATDHHILVAYYESKKESRGMRRAQLKFLNKKSQEAFENIRELRTKFRRGYQVETLTLHRELAQLDWVIKGYNLLGKFEMRKRLETKADELSKSIETFNLYEEKRDAQTIYSRRMRNVYSNRPKWLNKIQGQMNTFNYNCSRFD
ncbi:MAG: hypothetical protein U9Q06_02185 [Nanoarchaeota archaeon]|nr:hypothetical protein [Nanoarchaeota archaeon]